MGRKKRMGRPPLGERKKSEIVRIRVTKAELKRLQTTARELGISIAALLMQPWRKEE